MKQNLSDAYFNVSDVPQKNSSSYKVHSLTQFSVIKLSDVTVCIEIICLLYLGNKQKAVLITAKTEQKP